MQQAVMPFEEMKLAVTGAFNYENLMQSNVQNIKHNFEASTLLKYLRQSDFLSSCFMLQLELNSNTLP